MSEVQANDKKELSLLDQIVIWIFLAVVLCMLVFIPINLTFWVTDFMSDFRKFLREGSLRKLSWEQKQNIKKELTTDLKSELDNMRVEHSKQFNSQTEQIEDLEKMYCSAHENYEERMEKNERQVEELKKEVQQKTEIFTEQQMKEMRKGFEKICEIQTRYHESLKMDYGNLKQEVNQLKNWKSEFENRYKSLQSRNTTGPDLEHVLSKDELSEMRTDLTQLHLLRESFNKNPHPSSMPEVVSKFVRNKSINKWLPKVIKYIKK